MQLVATMVTVYSVLYCSFKFKKDDVVYIKSSIACGEEILTTYSSTFVTISHVSMIAELLVLLTKLCRLKLLISGRTVCYREGNKII